MVLGSRLAVPGAWREGGMPRYKFLANRGLTIIENAVLGTHFSRAAHGLPRVLARAAADRARSCATRSILSFDSEMIMQAVHFGFRIAEVPARTRYFADASSASATQSIIYGVQDAGRGGQVHAAPQRPVALAQVHADAGQGAVTPRTGRPQR